METYLFVMAIPIIWALFAYYMWSVTVTLKETGIQVGIMALLISAVYMAGYISQTSDTEIWNGEVVKKERIHDDYEQSYSCNCRMVSCGKDCTTSQCDTCYETHYTVDWNGKTTVGNVSFKSLDSTSTSVYASKDPQNYLNCKIGEPASIEHSYTNYIKAVPDSLFKAGSPTKANVPNYPKVHSLYKLNRVLNVGSKIKTKQLNDYLNNELKKLGKKKQVNIIVLFTNNPNPQYRYDVERSWLGGKKNDVVVLIGTDNNKILWADVMTWALNIGNELFHVKLRDDLTNLDTVGQVIIKNVKNHYDRPQMKDFEYLKDSIEPPTWMLYIVFFISIFGSVGLTFYFHKNEVA